MHEIAVCPGTPSDVVRLAPVVHALRRRGLPVAVVSAARDRAILGSTPAILGLSVDLDPTAANAVRDPEAALAAAFDRLCPSAVVVAGDAIAGVRAANAAAARRLRFAHVSGAGRTADPARAFRAEAACRRVARLATWHFVTGEAPRRRLLRAGVDPAAIAVAGATAADAARWTAARDGLFDRPPRAGARRVLVVARATRGDRRAGIVRAVARLAERADVEVVLATAPSPAERAALAVHENVFVRDRLAWDALVAEIAASHIVLADDGLAEEAAPALGVPVLAMRETGAQTEGGVLRCGTDPVIVQQHAERLLDDERLHRRMATASDPATDGRAADRIAARLAAGLAAAAPADVLAA